MHHFEQITIYYPYNIVALHCDFAIFVVTSGDMDVKWLVFNFSRHSHFDQSMTSENAGIFGRCDEMSVTYNDVTATFLAPCITIRILYCIFTRSILIMKFVRKL